MFRNRTIYLVLLTAAFGWVAAADYYSWREVAQGRTLAGKLQSLESSIHDLQTGDGAPADDLRGQILEVQFGGEVPGNVLFSLIALDKNLRSVTPGSLEAAAEAVAEARVYASGHLAATRSWAVGLAVLAAFLGGAAFMLAARSKKAEAMAVESSRRQMQGWAAEVDRIKSGKISASFTLLDAIMTELRIIQNSIGDLIDEDSSDPDVYVKQHAIASALEDLPLTARQLSESVMAMFTDLEQLEEAMGEVLKRASERAGRPIPSA